MGTSIAPGILLAAPSLRCPFFERTVVLLVDHSAEGSFGFVVNKLTDMKLTHVFEQLDIPKPWHSPIGEKVLLGGPVSTDTGWILFDPRSATQADIELARPIADGISCCASTTMIERIAAGDGPTRNFMVLGYAGWGAGQLDEELVSGSWFPVDLDIELLFDVSPDARWAAAYDMLGVDPSRVIDTGMTSA
ncbi:MAG: YqgE/AlgH family protein [Polyangiales bacterium]